MKGSPMKKTYSLQDAFEAAQAAQAAQAAYESAKRRADLIWQCVNARADIARAMRELEATDGR